MMKQLLCIWDKTFKYRNSHRNLMLQYIRDKKHERNIMRIGLNEEMKQDINQTQLNSTKQKQESWLIDYTSAAYMDIKNKSLETLNRIWIRIMANNRERQNMMIYDDPPQVQVQG